MSTPAIPKPKHDKLFWVKYNPTEWQGMYSELSSTNANFKRIYDSYAAFQKESVSWMRVTENTFDDFMAAMLRT